MLDSGFKSGLEIWEKMQSHFLEMKDRERAIVGEEAGSLGGPQWRLEEAAAAR